MIYTLTFNPAIDYFVRTDNFTAGTVNRACGEQFFFGGKGINVSFMLKTLGISSTALGFIAGFTGKAIEEGVEKNGVKTDFIRLEHGFSRINVKINDGTETELNGGGPEIDEKALGSLFEQLERLGEGDYLVLAGSVPKSLPPDIYSRIMKRLDGRGVRFVVDAYGELLLSVLPYKPFLIKPNHIELAELFGKAELSEDEIINFAEKLRKDGAKNVLVSRAKDGAVLVDERGAVHKISAAKGTVVNSVGAGDSMVAGFLAGYLKTKDYDCALSLGAISGGATAFSAGLGEIELIRQIAKENEKTAQLSFIFE